MIQEKVNASELRIGNYVLLDTGHTLPVWHQIQPEDLVGLWRNSLPKNVIIESIPITPDILDMCGFVNHRLRISEYTSLFHSETKNTHRVSLYYESWFAWCHVETVHQLQNLYYSLTNNELPIKIKTQ